MSKEGAKQQEDAQEESDEKGELEDEKGKGEHGEDYVNEGIEHHQISSRPEGMGLFPFNFGRAPPSSPTHCEALHNAKGEESDTCTSADEAKRWRPG